MMPNKSETSGNADSTTEDDPIGDDEDYSDGITEDTCPTWQTAFEDRMNDINGMLRTCDKPFKIPKDYRQAAKQFRRFEKFQQNAKGLMLRYREALDKTRYAADGSLRTELVGEDRQHYWHPFKGEKVYSERLAHEPPMIPVPHYSGYFEEEVWPS